MRHVDKKITILLINEKYILVNSYFYIHVSHLLSFDIDDVISFDTKYFFYSLTIFLLSNVLDNLNRFNAIEH